MSRLAAHHIQDWRKDHEASTINMLESSSNITSARQHALMWVYYPCVPKPMTLPPSPTINSVTCNGVCPDPQHHKIDPQANRHKSEYHKTSPFPPTNENIKKLKQWLLD